MTLTGKRLQVWHFPQVPCTPFAVDAKDEYEAMKLINTLADQHCWLFNNKLIPNYCNSFSVMMWSITGWEEYYNYNEQMNWDDFETTYEDQLTY